jgi:hypothetical protein
VIYSTVNVQIVLLCHYATFIHRIANPSQLSSILWDYLFNFARTRLPINQGRWWLKALFNKKNIVNVCLSRLFCFSCLLCSGGLSTGSSQQALLSWCRLHAPFVHLNGKRLNSCKIIEGRKRFVNIKGGFYRMDYIHTTVHNCSILLLSF